MASSLADQIARRTRPTDARDVGRLAVASLWHELALEPKPGLVSLRDTGAHDDMSATTFIRSLFALRGYFRDVAEAGAVAVPAGRMRELGCEAEARMLRATGGVNTHRGAIFVLGWLVAGCARTLASVGYPADRAVRATLAETWGKAFGEWPRPADSHGAHVAWRYGACGAVSEAAAGFPSVFTIGLPALRAARRRTGDVRLARLAALVALMARVHDTNVLHRGGVAGLRFVHERAAALACDPDLLTAHGAARARHLHAELVARRLSPGGCADLLAGTLFVDAVQRAAA